MTGRIGTWDRKVWWCCCGYSRKSIIWCCFRSCWSWRPPGCTMRNFASWRLRTWRVTGYSAAITGMWSAKEIRKSSFRSAAVHHEPGQHVLTVVFNQLSSEGTKEDWAGRHRFEADAARVPACVCDHVPIEQGRFLRHHAVTGTWEIGDDADLLGEGLCGGEACD